MATDVERLIVSLEASTTKYERALAKANGETEKRVRSMQRQFDGLGARVNAVSSGMSRSLGTVGRAFGVLGIALTTTSIIAMTSAWTDLGSRVNNAAGSVEKGAAVLDQLSVMARRTYSSLEQTAESYLNNSQALTALGYSTQQQLDLTEALNNALVISATRGQAAQSVMDAWSKAMADGKLSGQNLNTIIQRGGRLSKALADSMGVSVNELRKLGTEGKITTAAMYGVTDQLETLRAEANEMPATVSDGFVLLKDAVFKFVGQADAAVGSSNDLAEAIINLADALDRAPDDTGWDKFWGSIGDGLAEFIEEGTREVEFLSNVIDALSQKDPADVYVKLNAALDGNVRTAEDFELVLADAEQAVANLATNTAGSFGEVEEAVQDLFQQVLEGRASAEKAEKAILALGSVGDPEFSRLQSTILSVVANLYAVRDAAQAAKAAADSTTTDLGDFPTRRVFNNMFGPDLSSDGAPNGPITPPGAGSSKKSPAQKFQDDLNQYARRIEMLKQETALTAALNPLINDYGYAKERLKAIQELENAATKAGLALGPERRAEIEALAEGYAQATVEAAKLAEAQNATVRQMENLRDAGREALDTIIDGFLEGKDAGEIFGNVLKDIGKQLISMGLNSFMGGGGVGGFGLLGGLLGIPGRATGGPVRAGQPYIVGEKRPELFVPNQSGTIISRVPSAPTIPAAASSNGTGGFTYAPVIDARGADQAAIDRLERIVARQGQEFEGRVRKIVGRRSKDMW